MISSVFALKSYAQTKMNFLILIIILNAINLSILSSDNPTSRPDASYTPYTPNYELRDAILANIMQSQEINDEQKKQAMQAFLSSNPHYQRSTTNFRSNTQSSNS